MSTKDWAFSGYGILIDDVMANEIEKNVEYEKSFYSDVRDYLYEEDICDFIYEFTGEAFFVDDKGSVYWGESENFYYEQIWFVELKKMPTLFAAPYKNMCEIVDELKDKLGDYLPDDFDYKSRIRLISGTYYG